MKHDLVTNKNNKKIIYIYTNKITKLNLFSTFLQAYSRLEWLALNIQYSICLR